MLRMWNVKACERRNLKEILKVEIVEFHPGLMIEMMLTRFDFEITVFVY